MAETHLDHEIGKIKEELLKMGGLVETALDKSFRALSHRDTRLAQEIIEQDTRINETENIIDGRTIRLIATQQPVAVDLRFLTAALKMSTILERIGDQAANVCDRALAVSQLIPMEELPPTLIEMFHLAQDLIKKALDAFVRKDVALAYDVCCQDDELDELNRRLLEEMIGWMMEEQRLIRRGVELILAGRHLERVGDLATNVAEEVVFIVEGNVIRHQDVCGHLSRKGMTAQV